jgi:invasion protein IalB
MRNLRLRLAVVAAMALAAATPAAAQEAPAPGADAPGTEAPATAAPETEAPATAGEAAPDTAPEDAAPAAEAPEDAAPAADAPAAAGTAAEAPSAGGQDPATGDPAGPEVMEIVRDTFGDWQVRCSVEGTECFMYQLALDAQGNPVAEFSMLKLPEGGEAAAGATVVTPLGTLLTQGIVIQVDSGERRQYPFAWCSQVGCFARFGLDTPSLTGMKRGSTGTITLVSVGQPEQPVNLNLSLSGFTAAYDSLAVPSAAEAPPAQN